MQEKLQKISFNHTYAFIIQLRFVFISPIVNLFTFSLICFSLSFLLSPSHCFSFSTLLTLPFSSLCLPSLFPQAFSPLNLHVSFFVSLCFIILSFYHLTLSELLPLFLTLVCSHSYFVLNNEAKVMNKCFTFQLVKAENRKGGNEWPNVVCVITVAKECLRVWSLTNFHRLQQRSLSLSLSQLFSPCMYLLGSVCLSACTTWTASVHGAKCKNKYQETRYSTKQPPFCAKRFPCKYYRVPLKSREIWYLHYSSDKAIYQFINAVKSHTKLSSGSQRRMYVSPVGRRERNSALSLHTSL